MPNQQSWIFRWVFSVVFPKLIPKHILLNVKIIITDGDPQKYTQVDNAIENALPNARRIRCGWHIVAQGFDKHVNTTFPNISSNIVEDHKQIILNWMYSWMKDTCTMYLQYNYSRYLIMKYLYSSAIFNLFMELHFETISHFLSGNMSLHMKSSFCTVTEMILGTMGSIATPPLRGLILALSIHLCQQIHGCRWITPWLS